MDPDDPSTPAYRLRAAQVLTWDAGDSLAETMVRWRFRPATR